jgi:hypothetical protein
MAISGSRWRELAPFPHHVIHLSRWWSPVVKDQFSDRVLRIGQTRPVFVHTPMAVPSEECYAFDQNLNAPLHRKRRLFQVALMPPAATDEDRNELFAATIS